MAEHIIVSPPASAQDVSMQRKIRPFVFTVWPVGGAHSNPTHPPLKPSKGGQWGSGISVQWGLYQG